METRRFETQWGGKTLTIETGKLAGQANGSCTVRYGDTVVLAAATMSQNARENIDFFPLTVEYEEKMYASGKIKGSRFVKREGRPTDEAVMTSRMIDRAVRPLFPDGVRNEVQLVIDCLSVDLENDSDIPALIGASCALAMSDVPWDGPIGGVRVGRVDGEWVINPTFEARGKGDIDCIVAGFPTGVLMLECNAKEVSEEDMNEAIQFGQKHMREAIDLINQVVAAVGKPKAESKKMMGLTPGKEDAQLARRKEIAAACESFLNARLAATLFAAPKATKAERRATLSSLRLELNAHLTEKGMDDDERKYGLTTVDKIVDRAVCLAVVEHEQRVDGRRLTDIRALKCEVGLLPRTHGSGLFMRGETQVLSTVTLGSPSDVQVMDSMDASGKKRYFHHYNFPPFSVGETGRLGGAGRREIGHGGLAERAIEPVLPEKEIFPYTIRVVSEVLSSNGSSSQASACGSTLALMDAGVPIKRPVAGMAMGLATSADGRYKILTDLQDLEDGKGGMDFKVSGTRVGITTIQLDTKTRGLSKEIVWDTLVQAKDGRIRIIDEIERVIPEPRKELSPFAPRIETLKISPDRIRDVIGPGGKIINEIIDATGVTIDIENDGTVTICSANGPAMKRAIDWVKDLTREVTVGEMFESGKVVRIMDFGAFVELVPNTDGMVHVSELAPWRVNKVTDIVKIGDIIPVKVMEIDSMGRINLSMKQAMKDLGREQKMPEGYDTNPPPRRDGPPFRGGRGGGGGGGGFNRNSN